MKKLTAIMLVCMMLLPTVCIADESLSKSGSEMSDAYAQALSVFIALYDTGSEFNEDKANKLLEYSMMHLMGKIMYFAESEYATATMKKDIINGYAGLIGYYCELYQKYAEGEISLKQYVDFIISTVRSIIEAEAKQK